MLARLYLTASPPPREDNPARKAAVLAATREALAASFPSLTIVASTPPEGEEAIVVDAMAFRRPSFDCYAIDRAMDERAEKGPFALHISSLGADDTTSAHEIVTRYHRFLGQRNNDSQTPVFERVLARHRALYDLSKPLVRADYDHALDAWQWMLRLCPEASLAAQIAALFHDIERLVSEADVRVEHHATDYQRFKDRHARRGAAITKGALAGLDLDAHTQRRALFLVGNHERPMPDAELLLLNDADALSFFSLNSAGYLNYYGIEQTRRKVAYTLRRLRPTERRRLFQIRYVPPVEELVVECLVNSVAQNGGARLCSGTGV